MPDAHIASGPDARYRTGLAESHRGDRRAFMTLNTALEDYLARNDVKGATLASAVLVISGQVEGYFRRFEEHIARLVVVRDDTFPWGDRNEELTALTGLLAALNYFGPDDPFLPRCVERIMGLLETELDVNVRFAAGRAVLYYMEPRNLRALGQRTYSLLRPGMDSAELAPNRLARFLSMWMSCSRFAKEDRQAKLAEAQLRALSEKHNVPYIKFWLASVDVDRAMRERDVARAERGLADAESVADPASLGELE